MKPITAEFAHKLVPHRPGILHIMEKKWFTDDGNARLGVLTSNAENNTWGYEVWRLATGASISQARDFPQAVYAEMQLRTALDG